MKRPHLRQVFSWNQLALLRAVVNHTVATDWAALQEVDNRTLVSLIKRGYLKDYGRHRLVPTTAGFAALEQMETSEAPAREKRELSPSLMKLLGIGYQPKETNARKVNRTTGKHPIRINRTA